MNGALILLQPPVLQLPGAAALPHPRSARRIALRRGNVTRRADATRSATKRASARADHPDAKSTNGNKILQNDIRLNRARSTHTCKKKVQKRPLNRSAVLSDKNGMKRRVFTV